MRKKPVRGKPIDFSKDRFLPFRNYRLKPNCRALIENHILKEKAPELLASLEYLGSRRIEDVLDQELGPASSFFTTEILSTWLNPVCIPDCEPLVDVIEQVQNEPDLIIDMPIFAESPSGPITVTLLVSPDCFEIDPEGPESQRIH